MSKDNVNLAALDLNLITALDALLQTQSVSGAGDVVGRTQSAMSHSLSRLRDHFHDPILVRDGWAMHLTPFAEELRPRVAEAARAARQLFEIKTGFDPATSTRRIRIASPDLCASLFTGLIADLSQRAPGASVAFVDAPSARQAVLAAEAEIWSRLRAAQDRPQPGDCPACAAALVYLCAAPAPLLYGCLSTLLGHGAAHSCRSGRCQRRSG